MKSNVIDLTVQMHHQTDKADAVWLPRSQIEIEADGAAHVVTLPEWLAKEKGLV